MIKISTKDEAFNQAWCNASRALPVIELEMPRQYGERWRETYKCRIAQARVDSANYIIYLIAMKTTLGLC